MRDPLAARLRDIADTAGPVPERLAPALIAIKEIFGDDLATDPRFVNAVRNALKQLYVFGARGSVATVRTIL